MKKNENMDEIIEILKKGAVKFHDDLCKKLQYYFVEEKKEDEIIIHFNIIYDIHLEYLMIFKKLKTTSDHIPNVRGYNQLDSRLNPYRNLTFTDENEILGNIYDYIQEINVEEIACYQKFGIIIRNPIKLKGIYNINIKYVTE